MARHLAHRIEDPRVPDVAALKLLRHHALAFRVPIARTALNVGAPGMARDARCEQRGADPEVT